MPRPLRFEFKNAFYHVMNRGKGKQTIFPSDVYHYAFIKTLKEAHQVHGAVFHAYCLMGNHYHLLVQTPRGNISRIMRHIGGIYTQQHNKLKETDGPLFRGRFHSILIDSDEYALAVACYIHRNPIDCKIPLVSALQDYKWSSYNAYMGAHKCPAWLETNYIKSLNDRHEHKENYSPFCDYESDDTIEKFFSQNRVPSILGSNKFKEKVLEKEENVKSYKISDVHKKIPIGDIIQEAASLLNVSYEHLAGCGSGFKRKNMERKWAMYFCRHAGEYKLTEIATAFGISSIHTISRHISDINKTNPESETSRMTAKILSALLEK